MGIFFRIFSQRFYNCSLANLLAFRESFNQTVIFEAFDNNDRILLLRDKLDIRNCSALDATNPFSTHRWQGHAKHIHLDIIADIKCFVRVDNPVNLIEHKFRIEVISQRKRYMNGIIKGWSIQNSSN